MNYKDLENNLHFLDSTEFNHLLPIGCVQITDHEAEAIRLSTVVPPTYADLRANAYPPIGDQLDDLFRQGAFSPEMAAQLQAVKTAHPKGR